MHFFAVFLGRLFAFAPDEGGYLYTFNNVYSLPINTGAQSGSGWITAPTIFLWVAYLPAKILNLIGVSDYLSIRLLSILLTAVSLILLLEIQKGSQRIGRVSQKVIFLSFFIPSVFLWTSVGLRESFIIAEIAAFLAGLNFLFRGMNKKAVILLFLGSYGLLSTKNYLWVVLMAALITASIILLALRTYRRQVIRLIAIGFMVPLITFAGTTSQYALDFIFNSDISETGLRSGDSISQIYVETPDSGNSAGNSAGNSGGNNSGTYSGPNSGNNFGIKSGNSAGNNSGNTPKKELITFHGDYTLIALHFYLIDNPNSWFSKALGVFKLDKKIQSLWNEKVQAGLIHKDKKVGTDTSSFNGHILKPGKIDNPISMIWPAFVFLFGPFPFVGNPGIAIGISSLESPLWWMLYALVIFQFYRLRRVKFWQDPAILFTLIFLAGEIAFSALVEVNLGTSFRHRSILLIPLVFLYVRIAQRAHEISGNAIEKR